MTAPADPSTPKTPTANKSMAAGAGGLAGGGAGALVVALLDYRYHITLSPELASIVGGVASTVAAWIGAFFAPLITAAQEAALRKLQDEK